MSRRWRARPFGFGQPRAGARFTDSDRVGVLRALQDAKTIGQLCTAAGLTTQRAVELLTLLEREGHVSSTLEGARTVWWAI